MLDVTQLKPGRDGIVRLSTADTAKLVRQELKAKYPGVKFSVRSETYSMGSSITVSYTDGPADAEIEKILDVFTGSDFDGMQDLKTYRPAVEYQGVKVDMGSDHVIANRGHSNGVYETFGRLIAQQYGLPEPVFSYEESNGRSYIAYGNDYNDCLPGQRLSTMIYREFRQWSESDGLPATIDGLPSVKKATAEAAAWEAGRPEREAAKVAYEAAEAERQAREEAAKAAAEQVIAATVTAAKAKGWSGKVPAVAFMITGSESNRADCYRVFLSWPEIHEHIRYIAEGAPSEGGYDKTDFVVFWADGEEYGGRLDIQHPSRPAESNDNDLAAHIYEHVFFHAGLYTAETLPDHLTMEEYYSLLRMIGDDHQREMIELLEKYDIPQADHLAAVISPAAASVKPVVVAKSRPAVNRGRVADGWKAW